MSQVRSTSGNDSTNPPDTDQAGDSDGLTDDHFGDHPDAHSGEAASSRRFRVLGCGWRLVVGATPSRGVLGAPAGRRCSCGIDRQNGGRGLELVARAAAIDATECDAGSPVRRENDAAADRRHVRGSCLALDGHRARDRAARSSVRLARPRDRNGGHRRRPRTHRRGAHRVQCDAAPSGRASFRRGPGRAAGRRLQPELRPCAVRPPAHSRGGGRNPAALGGEVALGWTSPASTKWRSASRAVAFEIVWTMRVSPDISVRRFASRLPRQRWGRAWPHLTRDGEKPKRIVDSNIHVRVLG